MNRESKAVKRYAELREEKNMTESIDILVEELARERAIGFLNFVSEYENSIQAKKFFGVKTDASLNRQGWTRVEDGLPETLGEDILICYEMGGQTIIEIGYLCGERLIKGTTERYPPVTHWMPLPNKPSI